MLGRKRSDCHFRLPCISIFFFSSLKVYLSFHYTRGVRVSPRVTHSGFIGWSVTTPCANLKYLTICSHVHHFVSIILQFNSFLKCFIIRLAWNHFFLKIRRLFSTEKYWCDQWTALRTIKVTDILSFSLSALFSSFFVLSQAFMISLAIDEHEVSSYTLE